MIQTSAIKERSVSFQVLFIGLSISHHVVAFFHLVNHPSVAQKSRPAALAKSSAFWHKIGPDIGTRRRFANSYHSISASSTSPSFPVLLRLLLAWVSLALHCKIFSQSLINVCRKLRDKSSSAAASRWETPSRMPSNLQTKIYKRHMT